MSILYSQEVDYKNAVASHGSYHYNKLTPMSGSQTVVLSLTGSAECSFELGSNVMNLSRSHLSFDLDIGAQGGTNLSKVNAGGVSVIDRISLMTRGGQYLCDVSSLNNYTKVVMTPTTAMSDYLALPNARSAAAIGDGVPGCMFSPARTIVANNSHADDLPPTIDYTEPDYVINGTGAPAQCFFKIQIPFKRIVDTILAMDKNLYFAGETLVLRVQFAAGSKWGFGGSSATVHATALAPLIGAVSATNIAMYLAVESNADVAKALIDKVSGSGLSMLIPYVHTMKYASGASLSSSVNYRFNRSHGKTLLRVWHSLFNAVESEATAYTHSSIIGGYGVDTAYTSMNHRRLQDFTMSIGQEDFMLMSQLAEGSALQNRSQYIGNWFWCDDWTSGKAVNFNIQAGLESGLDLTDEKIWSANFTHSNVAYNHYTFAVCQRVLTLNSQGVVVM